MPTLLNQAFRGFHGVSACSSLFLKWTGARTQHRLNLGLWTKGSLLRVQDFGFNAPVLGLRGRCARRPHFLHSSGSKLPSLQNRVAHHSAQAAVFSANTSTGRARQARWGSLHAQEGSTSGISKHLSPVQLVRILYDGVPKKLMYDETKPLNPKP